MRRSTVGSAGAVVASALALLASLTVPLHEASAAPAARTVPAGVSARGAESLARASLAHLAPGRAPVGSERDLRLTAVRPLGDGDQVVRFQQLAAGVPVYAGELAVQVDRGGSVLSVTGETADVPAAAARTVTPAAAQSTALLDEFFARHRT